MEHLHFPPQDNKTLVLLREEEVGILGWIPPFSDPEFPLSCPHNDSTPTPSPTSAVSAKRTSNTTSALIASSGPAPRRRRCLRRSHCWCR